jgi:hypothetical protein
MEKQYERRDERICAQTIGDCERSPPLPAVLKERSGIKQYSSSVMTEAAFGESETFSCCYVPIPEPANNFSPSTCSLMSEACDVVIVGYRRVVGKPFKRTLDGQQRFSYSINLPLAETVRASGLARWSNRYSVLFS